MRVSFVGNRKGLLMSVLIVWFCTIHCSVLMCSIWSAWVGGYFIKIYRESFGPRTASASSSASLTSASAKAALGGSSAAAADAAGSSPSTAPKRKSARAD